MKIVGAAWHIDGGMLYLDVPSPHECDLASNDVTLEQKKFPLCLVKYGLYADNIHCISIDHTLFVDSHKPSDRIRSIEKFDLDNFKLLDTRIFRDKEYNSVKQMNTLSFVCHCKA